MKWISLYLPAPLVNVTNFFKTSVLNIINYSAFLPRGSKAQDTLFYTWDLTLRVRTNGWFRNSSKSMFVQLMHSTTHQSLPQYRLTYFFNLGVQSPSAKVFHHGRSGSAISKPLDRTYVFLKTQYNYETFHKKSKGMPTNHVKLSFHISFFFYHFVDYLPSFFWDINVLDELWVRQWWEPCPPE